MDYFTKWPEALLSNFFCRFGVHRELHSDQGRNFESHLMQEVLQCLGVKKTRTTPLHPQSDGMVERYIKTVEHLRKVVASHQRDWDARLPIFLLAYRASTHDTPGLTPANLMFWRDLRLPGDLLFGAPSDKEQPTINHAADVVDWVHNIHDYARQHLKLASDRMKTHYNKAANCAGYQEWDKVWLYRPTRTKGKSPKF
jgi:transposase InsO family protein